MPFYREEVKLFTRLKSWKLFHKTHEINILYNLHSFALVPTFWNNFVERFCRQNKIGSSGIINIQSTSMSGTLLGHTLVEER